MEDELSIRLAILETKFEASQLALNLQGREYERRLDILNHSHQDLMNDRSDFLTIRSYENRHETLVSRIESLEKWQAKVIGIAIASGALASFILKEIIK